MIAQINNAVRHNIVEKLIAIVAAAVLWVFVMEDQNPVIESSYTVPLTFVNASENYKVLHGNQQVKLKLRGPRSYFVNYEAKDCRAYLNLAGLEEGDHEVKIETAFPPGFELISVTPEQTQIKLDPYIERQMPAELIVTGATGANATVTRVTQSADTVTLIGSRTAVDAVTRVIGYVGLSGNKESFTLQVTMTPINEDGRAVPDVKSVPSQMNVDVQIELDLIRKTVPIEADILVADGFEIERVTIDPAQIEIAGKETVINPVDNIKTDAITVPLGDKSVKQTVDLLIPDGVTANIKEVTVEVVMKEKKQ